MVAKYGQKAYKELVPPSIFSLPADERSWHEFTGLKMPKFDGIEVFERIKSNELTRKIPVVVLTSSRENPDIDKCYSLGANSFIVKPVDFAGFMKAIRLSGMYWTMLNQPLQ